MWFELFACMSCGKLLVVLVVVVSYLYNDNRAITLHNKSSTVNCQLSTVNCQLSTVNCQPSTVNTQRRV